MGRHAAKRYLLVFIRYHIHELTAVVFPCTRATQDWADQYFSMVQEMINETPTHPERLLIAVAKLFSGIVMDELFMAQ